MSDLSFKKIEQSINDRKRLHVSFLKHVKTYKPFLELEDKAFSDGALSKKTKELMALSISIVTKCEPCMEWHLDQAMLVIMAHQEKAWQMKPNRKIMPSRWVVTDPGQHIAMQFDQKMLGKLINPLYKTALTLEDGQGKELFRLVDPRTNIPDRVLSVGPNDWALMDGDQPVAKLVRLSRQTAPAKGIFGKLKKIFSIFRQGDCQRRQPACIIGTDGVRNADAIRRIDRCFWWISIIS